VLRIKLRIRRKDQTIEREVLGIVNSGFIGIEPEIVMPTSLSQELRLDDVSTPRVHDKILADGRRVSFTKYSDAVFVSALTEDYETESIRTSVLILETVRHVLINDKLAGGLGIVILDLGEGLWCFKHELGKKIRKTL
jgi:hypothetical protein